MIGGRVFAASALVAFAAQRSVHAAALVWTAVEENIVLVVPSTAIATAWADLEDKHHPVLEVLLRLPVIVVDVLDGERARAVGGLGGAQLEAHAVACSRERGRPLVTRDWAPYGASATSTPSRCPDLPPGGVSRWGRHEHEPSRKSCNQWLSWRCGAF